MSGRLLILDSGLGNVRSVSSMLRRIGKSSQLIDRPVELLEHDRIILPGVGAFDAGMTALKSTGLGEFVTHAAGLGYPVLGICLGMQLLCEGSEEGKLPGLGLIAGGARMLPAPEAGLRLPHMGWNVVRPTRKTVLFDPADSEQRFYFVHSYHVICEDSADVAAETGYGIDFTCAFEHGNLIGVQFHPEKSHRFGMNLLRRFVETAPF